MSRLRILTIAALFSASGAYAQDAPAGNVEQGKTLYAKVGCYACHGTVGQGGAAGPRITPAMPYQAFLMQMRTPRDTMIPYHESVLPDSQVADIYAYVASIPKPQDYKSIDLLR